MPISARVPLSFSKISISFKFVLLKKIRLKNVKIMVPPFF